MRNTRTAFSPVLRPDFPLLGFNQRFGKGKADSRAVLWSVFSFVETLEQAGEAPFLKIPSLRPPLQFP